MKFSTFIPAKIVYPDISSFIDDDGKRFQKGYGPIFNELLDAIKVNATIYKSYFGSCQRLNNNLVCTDALKMFQEARADFYKLPVPLILLGNIQEITTVGATSDQLTHAMGSVTPTINGTKHELDMLDTVKADHFSIGVFMAMPLIIYMLNLFSSKLILQKNRFRRLQDAIQPEGGHLVMNKLIRIILNQPNYTPKDTTMKIMIILYLMSTLFVLTVYRNIFGSDLTVTDGAVHLDYIWQLNASKRYVIHDPIKTTKNLIYSSAGDAIPDLFISRTIPGKSDLTLLQSNLISEALIRQDAVMITNLYYHKYTEGGYCLDMINRQGGSPASRYHLSKETFLPTVTTYVYGRHIDAELKRRLDAVLQIYLEYGIETVQNKEKPRIAFLELTSNEKTYFCTQKSGFHHNEESVPQNVSLKPLKKTLKGCLIFCVISLVALMFEMISFGVKKMADLIKDKKKRKERRKIRTRKKDIKNFSSTPKFDFKDPKDAESDRQWMPCIVTTTHYQTPINYQKICNGANNYGVWKDANVEFIEFKGYQNFWLRKKD